MHLLSRLQLLQQHIAPQLTRCLQLRCSLRIRCQQSIIHTQGG
jgi:hypothetical protein